MIWPGYECPEHTGHWAWKYPHRTDGTVTYTELKGDITMEDVDFGYVPGKTVLHDVTLYAHPGQKIAFVRKGVFVEKRGRLRARFAHIFCSKRSIVVVYYILSKYALERF